MVRLDIISDPVCPWCYIGKANLDRALERHPEHPFLIEWHPFQLNPEMPKPGMPRAEYLAAKFGKADAAAIYARIDAAAEAAGLSIDWGAIARMPNTLDVHRLIHWAGIEGRQTPMVGRIFRAYWQDGLDIGDAGVLADLAAEIGMDRALTAQLLAGDADAEDIRARDTHSRARGVTGVPTFVIAGQHVLSGAQPADLWGRVIDEIVAQLAPENGDGPAAR
jgi:predicted DsbA family dithiol-disulfide isomerase